MSWIKKRRYWEGVARHSSSEIQSHKKQTNYLTDTIIVLYSSESPPPGSGQKSENSEVLCNSPMCEKLGTKLISCRSWFQIRQHVKVPAFLAYFFLTTFYPPGLKSRRGILLSVRCLASPPSSAASQNLVNAISQVL